MNQPTHIIDPGGDVMIVLRNSPFAQDTSATAIPQGSGDDVQSPTNEAAHEENTHEPLVENYFYIQVSAQHLILASPVFKSFLTGAWENSTTHLFGGPVEIPAERWDVDALLILLRGIHNQYCHIPRKLTLEMLAKVAVIADYYECKESIKIMNNLWIYYLGEIPTIYCRDLILWVWISWFFQLPVQFTQSTSTVMSCSEDEINSCGLPIPDKVIESMNKGRQEAIENLIICLYETREAFQIGDRGCEFVCRSLVHESLTREMESNGLLSPEPEAPFPNLSYKSLMGMVESFNSPPYGCVCSDSKFASLPPFSDLNDFVGGLYLNQHS